MKNLQLYIDLVQNSNGLVQKAVLASELSRSQLFSPQDSLYVPGKGIIEPENLQQVIDELGNEYSTFMKNISSMPIIKPGQEYADLVHAMEELEIEGYMGPGYIPDKGRGFMISDRDSGNTIGLMVEAMALRYMAQDFSSEQQERVNNFQLGDLAIPTFRIAHVLNPEYNGRGQPGLRTKTKGKIKELNQMAMDFNKNDSDAAHYLTNTFKALTNYKITLGE